MNSAHSGDPLRLLVIAPRFWPQFGDVEFFAANLADELVALGCRPTVLSCKWSPAWPDQITVREVPIVRLHQAPRGGVSSLRYMIELGRWLRATRGSFDAVYVLGMRHEAYATVGALCGGNVPVLLRCHDTGPVGDCAWQHMIRFGERFRRRCQFANSVIASGADSHRELIASGFANEKIHSIAAGASTRPARTADARFRARNALAEANHDLTVAEYSPVFIAIGRLREPQTFQVLLDAWRDVAASFPSARLWLVGDGPGRESIYERVNDLELKYQVFMPGSFDDLGDLLMAADVFVCPDPQSNRQITLEAMAAGLEIIAAEGSDLDDIIKQTGSGSLVRSTDRTAWIAALTRLCDNPPAALGKPTSAQEQIARRYSRRAMALAHVDLIRQLVSK